MRILVAGGGGFIGGHLVNKLLQANHEVVVADIKPIDQWYQHFDAAENHCLNLEEKDACYKVITGCDHVYNLACNMGGMGFIEYNRALCMISVLINTHLLMASKDAGVKRYLYASSACVYAEEHQLEAADVSLKESDAYPAMPENGYGWEKLFSERMCQHFMEDFGLEVRIVRLHNVYGPHGTWDGGREKAPAALCRKVAVAEQSDDLQIEIWGDGEQSRSFMYIDDCLLGFEKIMANEFPGPINLGRSELVTINQLLETIETVAGIKMSRSYNSSAPQGVRGRNSNNDLIQQVYNWEPSISLHTGITRTYPWIQQQVLKRSNGDTVLS